MFGMSISAWLIDKDKRLVCGMWGNSINDGINLSDDSNDKQSAQWTRT